MTTPRPSRVLVGLLAAISSRDRAQAATGDILEDLEMRRGLGHAPTHERLWLNLQVLRCAGAAVASASPRVLRTAGHVIRDAARTLRRSPAHSLFILTILSVGLSAATTTFSVVDAVMFKPFPFERSEDLLVVNVKGPRYSSGLRPEEYWAVHDKVSGFESVAPVMWSSLRIEAGGVSETVATMFTTSDAFGVLRLKPLIGRLWTLDDERRGDLDVVVLSYAIWQRRFGGDAGVVGQTIPLRGQPMRIIGVLPKEAVYPTSGSPMDLWRPSVPVRVAPEGGIVGSALARLRRGVTLEQARAETEAVMPPPRPTDRQRGGEWRVQLVQWDRQTTDADVRSWLWLLLGVVALIVLIACFNAANVMLTRSFHRARELAVRASLGASRRQLVATLATEGVLLSSLATGVALVVAHWSVQVIKTSVPVSLFRREEIAVDGRIFAAAAATALLTGLIFGAVPALQASRASVVGLLKDAGTASAAGRRRWRSAFLVAEIASVGILLVVSTLFIGSFVHLTSVDLGYDRSHLIGVSTITGYAGTVEDVRTRFAQIPGVEAVAAVGTTSLPLVSSFGGAYMNSPLAPVDGPADATVDVEVYRVTSNYFNVMGIPITRGSTWGPIAAGTTDFQPMVLEETAARRIFGARDPIGLQVKAKDLDNRVFTIVGLVPAVLPHGPEQSASGTTFHDRPTAYYAMNTATRPSWVSMLIRTQPAPGTVVRQVEAAYKSVAEPTESAGVGVHLFNEGFDRMTAKRRFNASLMSAFALFALIIGAAGIYAVMASVVAQQTREIGVRVALGATPAMIRRGVLGMAARHVGMGLLVGLPVAWWISRGFAGLFFQVQPSDVSVYAVVAAAVAAVAALGAFIPARRAAHVDPAVSLRA